MNRTRILKSSLLILVVFAVLIGAAVVAQATALNSSAVSGDVTRQPRPHPKSHIKITDTATAIESGSSIRYPRPHPKSHIKLVEPGSALSPRPHPTSHIEMLVSRP